MTQIITSNEDVLKECDGVSDEDPTTLHSLTRGSTETRVGLFDNWCAAKASLIDVHRVYRTK